MKQQGNNRRNNRVLTYNGESLTLTQWAEKIGCDVSVLYERLKHKWTIEKTLVTPVQKIIKNN